MPNMFLGGGCSTNKVCGKVLRVVWCVCIMTADGGLEVRSCKVAFMTDHDAGDVMGKFVTYFLM